MELHFTKMHGAGNDFIVIDGIHQDLSNMSRAQWRYLADRQFGIGADQILLIEKPTRPDAEFKYRIINHDGSEVEQCGNGSRCFVRFVREKNLTDKKQISVEVAHTLLVLSEKDHGLVEVNMGAPVLDLPLIPFHPSGLESRVTADTINYLLPTKEGSFWVTPVSMGNPHAVQIVDALDKAPVLLTGPLIEHHPSFPARVNAGFMQIIDRNTIHLRVFERGSGETLSCGTGACAAVVAGILQGVLDSPVSVHTKGGELLIEWQYANDGKNASVMMTGPAETVFEGKISVPDL
ncbi:diaminopimelate epimerase [Polynucleobacter kasalickyi]|uniref:Diaminopimelate epimerase n=1 Tax=Polynucleobacter kasalickyi TaxID=1938817 RepID=A0A1W2AVL9_9BURK|nr:diaminopimelate epimerase [Polynucleobacter kasalickyi]SMC64735.1 diaminopimelate epimerase [Polynucleobacter kasalickyi]